MEKGLSLSLLKSLGEDGSLKQQQSGEAGVGNPNHRGSLVPEGRHHYRDGALFKIFLVRILITIIKLMQTKLWEENEKNNSAGKRNIKKWLQNFITSINKFNKSSLL